MGCTLLSCGKALPTKQVTNDELSHLVETDNEWIVSRTGIQSRAIAHTETVTSLAVAASKQALGSDYSAGSLDVIICATMTPDDLIPSAACRVKEALGATNAIAFDINAACTGFIYALSVAEAMMASNATASNTNPTKRLPHVRRALVIGAECLSRVVDWTDRTTCVLFGDGAGATIWEWRDDSSGIQSIYLTNTDDSDGALTCTNPIMKHTFPLFNEREDDIEGTQIDESFIRMKGQAVFRFAVESLTNCVNEALSAADVSLDDVSLIVAHQANERIITSAARHLGLPLDKFVVSLAHTGNTSAASVPLALAEAHEKGLLISGNKVVLTGFGGGLCAGALVLEV